MIATMRIHACLSPPSEAIAHLTAALGPERAHAEQVAWMHPAHWQLYLANFGNLSHIDAVRLTRAFSENVCQLPPLTLQLAGIIPLPEDGDDSIWVGVKGDLDRAAKVASSIHSWVFALGFVLDRRASYRPRIRLGEITDRTTVAGVEQLVDRLGSYEGPPWTVKSVTLGSVRPPAPNKDIRFDVFDEAKFSDDLLHRSSAPDPG